VCLFIPLEPHTTTTIKSVFNNLSFSLKPRESKGSSSSMAGNGKGAVFEDLLPVMADKLGGDGLIRELCNGFQLLMDKDKGVITLESLRRNSALLGLQDLKEDELVSMVKEGDLDGDGALNQMEFCVLMFRLSPELMEDSHFWLEEAVEEELKQN
jgi:Ca2+-binding EF-hand superfamily protein